MKKIYIYLFFLTFLTNIVHSVAQNNFGNLKGFVYLEKSGEPISYATVYLEGTNIGTTTDINGFFSITRIPAGNYKLVASDLSYGKIEKEVSIFEGKTENVRLMLSKSAVELNAFEISKEKDEAKNEVKISTFSITPATMQRMPTIGGEADIAQYLQVLPGVVSTGDQGGQLYIRGGPPIQNKVLLDGATMYNAFHSIGLFSVFDTDILRNADVYTGGFGAQYGGRISSIMDITTRDGNRKRISGKIGVTPFTAKAVLEGPLLKMKENRNTSVSFLLSGRGSYLEHSSTVFYPYASGGRLPFNFWDIYGKITVHAGNNGSKINAFGFANNDFVNYSDVTSLKWNNYGGGLNFIFIPTATNINIDGVFSYSSYKINMFENNEQQLERSSLVNGFNLNINLHQFVGVHRISYGLEANATNTDLVYDTPYSTRIKNEQNTTEIAAYVRAKFSKWGIVFDPSFRLHYYASLGEISPEPRLGIKINATKWMRFKLAGGLYSQSLIAANSDRDVVNLFYGIITRAESVPKKFQGNDVKSRLMKAQHAIAGVEFDAGNFVQFNLEGYYMNFSQLMNTNRNKLYNDGTPGVPDYQTKDIIVEKGFSAGFDFTAKVEWKSLYIWVVYSFMKTQRTDELGTYNPHFDRTHNINIVANYAFGKNKDWEISGRWNIGSGFPFTQTQGFYELLPFQDGLNFDYTKLNGQLGIQYTDVNSGRLPWYHRLDLNIKKKFIFKNDLKLEVNVGATNIYNRNNIFYVDRVTAKRVDQLPILYNVGLNFSF